MDVLFQIDIYKMDECGDIVRLHARQEIGLFLYLCLCLFLCLVYDYGKVELTGTTFVLLLTFVRHFNLCTAFDLKCHFPICRVLFTICNTLFQAFSIFHIVSELWKLDKTWTSCILLYFKKYSSFKRLLFQKLELTRTKKNCIERLLIDYFWGVILPLSLQF